MRLRPLNLGAGAKLIPKRSGCWAPENVEDDVGMANLAVYMFCCTRVYAKYVIVWPFDSIILPCLLCRACTIILYCMARHATVFCYILLSSRLFCSILLFSLYSAAVSYDSSLTSLDRPTYDQRKRRDRPQPGRRRPGQRKRKRNCWRCGRSLQRRSGIGAKMAMNFIREPPQK